LTVPRRERDGNHQRCTFTIRERRRATSTIFKIPQTCRAEILVTEGMKDPEDEFKYVVEKSKFGGLLFEKLWDSNVEA